jgi:hypothetical protein
VNIDQQSRGLSQRIAELGANTAGFYHVERIRRELSKEGFQVRSES